MSITDPSITSAIQSLRASNPMGGITQDQAVAKYQAAKASQQASDAFVDNLPLGGIAKGAIKGVGSALSGLPTFDESTLSTNTAVRDWAQQKEWDSQAANNAIMQQSSIFDPTGAYRSTAYQDYMGAKNKVSENVNAALDTAEGMVKANESAYTTLKSDAEKAFDGLPEQVDKNLATAQAKIPGLQAGADLAAMRSYEAADQAYAQTKADLDQKSSQFLSFLKGQLGDIDAARSGELSNRANDVAKQIDTNISALQTNLSSQRDQILQDLSARGVRLDSPEAQKSLMDWKWQGAKQAQSIASTAQIAHNAAVDAINQNYTNVRASVVNGLGSTYGNMLTGAGSTLASMAQSGADIKSKASQWLSDSKVGLAKYSSDLNNMAVDSKGTLALNRSNVMSQLESLRLTGQGQVADVMAKALEMNQYVSELPYLSTVLGYYNSRMQQEITNVNNAVNTGLNAISLFKSSGSSGSSSSGSDSSLGWANLGVNAAGLFT